MKHWLPYFRPGDWVILLGGIVLLIHSLPQFWAQGRAERALIHQDGQLFLEAPLLQKRIVEVPGPLGITLIEIDAGRARIAADPGPRQYCVRQGWLMRPGEIALCAPNRVSLLISGRTRTYDSLSY